MPQYWEEKRDGQFGGHGGHRGEKPRRAQGRGLSGTKAIGFR